MFQLNHKKTKITDNLVVKEAGITGDSVVGLLTAETLYGCTGHTYLQSRKNIIRFAGIERG